MSKTPTLEERARRAALRDSGDSYESQVETMLEHLRAVEAEGRAAEREQCARWCEDQAKQADEAAQTFEIGHPARRGYLTEASVLLRAASAIRDAK